MIWRQVCESRQLVEGEGLEVVLDGLVIAIFRLEGQLYAIDGMCAHQGGPLARGFAKNGCITCPWHGWQYALQSGNNAVTNKPMLQVYSVRDDGQNIFVALT